MLIIAVAGKELEPRERDWLAHAAVAGVTLFARNFHDRDQVTHLIDDMRASSPAPLVICVDQEGGTVQRFREGFTVLPALQTLGERYRTDPADAISLAEQHAWIMASEMRAIGIDVSFAPVVDLGRGNRAIGTRAFDADPEVVAALGAAYVRGMRSAGMAATLKHFPGHGSVAEDTHFETACDPRALQTILDQDLQPFREGFAAGAEAVMMAHVVYPEVAPEPAGYSATWIGDVLRKRMGFQGVVMSDDIGMLGAAGVGAVAERIARHRAAGCDLVLVCQPDAVPEAIAAVEAMHDFDAGPGVRAAQSLSGRAAAEWNSLVSNPQRDRFICALHDLSSGAVSA